MLKIDEYFKVLDKYAPIKYSYESIEKGEYDNSGIILRCKEDIKRVLFSLDLTKESVSVAKKRKCDLIVTHHPAIYTPIKNISISDYTAPVAEALKNDISVISMHLNLDFAENGIDERLSMGLGAKKSKILFPLEDGNGYGREFALKISFAEFIKKIKTEFDTQRVISYGDGISTTEKVASFCGGGSSFVIDAIRKNLISADTIVSSDIPHHIIKEIVESDKKLVILPHYAAEEYGFKFFYETIKKDTEKEIESIFFSDKRFK